MNTTSITYDHDAEGYRFTLTESETGRRARITVPLSLLRDECGANSGEAEHVGWIEENLAGILHAWRARENGGWVQPPMGRLVVEELD